MRAIDADALKEDLTRFYDNEVTARKLIDEQPTIQPEIVRCKDCKYWREGTSFSYCDKLHGMGVLDALDYMTAEDDYCSMAERRQDGRLDQQSMAFI